MAECRATPPFHLNEGNEPVLFYDEIDLLPHEADIPVHHPPTPVTKKSLSEILEMSSAIHSIHGWARFERVGGSDTTIANKVGPRHGYKDSEPPQGCLAEGILSGPAHRTAYGMSNDPNLFHELGKLIRVQ